MNKIIWEGWTVQNFVDELEMEISLIMTNKSWQKPFQSQTELKKYCIEHQPYYKKHIPEVTQYFIKKYNIK